MITIRVSIAALALALLPAGPAVAAGNDYGPDTCLRPWVWREAFAGDHVCVLPATRSQAWEDNRLAASRRSPNGGPYGPDTCLPGWVWREASATDRVCVSPATRAQAAADNREAANRRASVSIWAGSWYPGPVCQGDVCSITSDHDIPRFKINGDHFNLDHVTVGVYRASDGSALWKQTVRAGAHPGYPGGSFGVNAGVIDCSFGGTSTNTPINAYLQAYDHASGRWSARIPVRTGCIVF